MVRRLLVPLDGSKLAEASLPAAAAVARAFGAAVTLLHVLEEEAPREVHGQRHLTSEPEARAYLEETAARFFASATAVDVHVHPEAVRAVARSIAEHEGELDFDLVVMSVHGRGRTARILFASVAQQVLAQGSRPVLLLHAEDPRVQKRFPCRLVLLPFDAQPEHEPSFDRALQLARGLGSPLRLVLVVPTLGTLSGQGAASAWLTPRAARAMQDLSAARAEEILAEKSRRARALGLEVSAEVLRGDPARSIVRTARRAEADLIVTATHGRTGWGGFWAGSVAHGIYSRCLLPLLLVPAQEGGG